MRKNKTSSISSRFLPELELLQDTIYRTNQSLKHRIGKDDGELDKKPSLGVLLYSITKDIPSNILFEMSDADIITHIQKVQINERDL